MEILKPAMAGTLESSDAQVMVEPAAKGIELILESSVINQYGKQIRKTILETRFGYGYCCYRKRHRQAH